MEVLLLVVIIGLLVWLMVLTRSLVDLRIESTALRTAGLGRAWAHRKVMALEILAQSYSEDMDDYWVTAEFAELCRDLKIDIPRR